MSDGNENGRDQTSLAALLEDGLFVDGDWVESKDQDPNGDVRLIQLADVGDGIFRNRSSRHLTMQKARELRCTLLEPGDILVARMPEPLGRACIFPGVQQPAVTAVDVCIIRPNPERVRSDWLVGAINSPEFRGGMSDFIRGTTRQRISRKNLGKLELHVPAIDTQADIAATLDRVERKRRGASTHAASARAAIERCRGAILAAACSGRLTADWREAHPDATADRLHAALIETRRNANPRKRGSPEEHGLTSEAQLELRPPSWSLVRLGDILDVGTGATPLRKNRAYYDNGTIPWVTSGAVNAGTITSPTELITPLALKETNVKLFAPGTLLVAMYGEGQTRGRVAELAIESGTNQAVAAVLFADATAPLRPFIRIFFEDSYRRVRALSVGGVQPNLNLGMIKDTLLPLPPLAEQAEIVRRTTTGLAVADRLAGQIDHVTDTLSRVSRATLAQAFRGELVLTEGSLAAEEERDFEPAEELLARVEAERWASTKPKVRRRPRV